MVHINAIAFCSALLFLSPSAVKADFGDYVDPTFNCPAMTTCRQVCVADVTDCPAAMQCGENEMLCADGVCAPFCTGNEVTPCEFACAPVACPKVVDSLDNCTTLYSDLLAAEAACGAEETAVEVSLWDFNEGGFVFIYTWISVATVLVIGWCAFNQRLAPVEGSTQALELSFSNSADKNASKGYQTGYKLNPVGLFINLITIATILGIQGLLIYLTVQYYVQQELITGVELDFEDEVQVLIAFELTWRKLF